jgi:F-box and leucine-rich repeat protein 10/11
MSCGTWKKGLPPSIPRDRTPSPPRDAVEPLTPPPHRSSFYHTTSASGYSSRHKLDISDNGNRHAHSAVPSKIDTAAKTPLNQRRSSHAHASDLPYAHVPNSPIDTLANAASSLASSPVFASSDFRAGSRRGHGAAQQTWSPLNSTTSYQHGTDQRPYKRARSELLPSPDQLLPSSRPTTSYIPSQSYSYNVEQEVDSASVLINGDEAPRISHHRKWSEADVAQAELLLFLSTGGPNTTTTSGHRKVTPSDAGRGHVSLIQSHEESELILPKKSSSAVQTQTPPEETYVSAADQANRDEVTHISPSGNQEVRASAKMKPKRNKSSLAGPSRRKKASKSTEEGNNTAALHEIEPDQLHSPQSMGIEIQAPRTGSDGTLPDDTSSATATEAASTTRRRSLSNMNTSTLQVDDQTNSRAASVPRDTPMVIKRLDPAAIKTQPLDTSEPTTVCAGCHFVSTFNGETTNWIACDGCKQWYHFVCGGFRNEREVRNVDKFFCSTCKPVHGPTTCKEAPRL